MQTPIKIEKSVPCPPGRFSIRLYPIDQLEIGDSFAVPSEQARCLRSVLGPYKASHPGWNYTCRAVDKADGTKETRVWRLA